MTVSQARAGVGQIFVGWSTDTKPAGALPTDRFYEQDTGIWWVYGNANGWNQATLPSLLPVNNGYVLVGLNGAGAGGQTGDFQNQKSYTGLLVVVSVSALAGTSPTLTVTIQGRNYTSYDYWTILSSAAIAATGVKVLRVKPELTTVANQAASDILPTYWRLTYAVGGSAGQAVTADIYATYVE